MTVLQTVRSISRTDSTVAAISVNCMSVQRAEEVFARISQGLEEAMEGNPTSRPPIICPGIPLIISPRLSSPANLANRLFQTLSSTTQSRTLRRSKIVGGCHAGSTRQSLSADPIQMSQGQGEEEVPTPDGYRDSG